MDDGALRSRLDDDEVAIPRFQLLELREHLLALGATLDALDPLLGLARPQIEAGYDELVTILRDLPAQGDRVEQRARRISGLEGRIEVRAHARRR